LLVASAATAGLLAASGGMAGLWRSGKALSAAAPAAAPGAAGESAGIRQVASNCNACSSKCGFIATVKDGRLWKLQGNPAHPNSKGMLCARGHGYAQIAYSSSRLTDPLKRGVDGSFSAISWEQAYSEIGKKVKDIIAADGPEALSLIEDPRPSGKYYSHRFINALGSDNYYHHSAACNLSLTSGYLSAIGATNFSADIGSTKIVVFIGRSYADGIRPSSASTLAAAKASGTKVVIVDPRMNNTSVLADQWLPINPGTDLALLLAIAHTLVVEDLYNKEFVANEAYGFEEWAASLSSYTPAWAAGVTGLDEQAIVTLAKELAAAAPKAVVENGWRGGFGCQYQNSTETARAIAAVNALLGNWNRKGGALVTSTPKIGALDADKFPALPPTPEKAGLAEFPLMDEGPGSNLIVPLYAKEGKIKAVFFYNSNAVKGYANPKSWQEALEKMELSVCIDVQMSETALLCDYVLPECSYLERDELPDLLGGKQGNACVRQKVIDLVHPNTKSCDRIYAELAEACGVGQYFSFTQEELARAQLDTLGVSYEELSQKGAIPVGSPFVYDKMPAWKTPTGKFQFSSPAHEEAGFEPLIHWVAPLVSPQGNEFRLIGGKQSIHSHQMTTSIEALMAITRDYSLERAWINAERAKELGIKDGDTVTVQNSEHSGTVRVKVTERLNPTAIWIPTHYGGSSPELKAGYGIGLGHMDFVPFMVEPGVGSAMTQEVCVTVRKVDAQ
jgi:thiosulfate reductase/polysulfide reductase chain A